MLQDILKFTSFLQQFREIKRILVYPTSDIQENDAEHSFQLAILGWYIIDYKNLDLDIGKAIRYALIHDFVEVYAGDTPFDADQNMQISKHEREQQAIIRMKKEFPECEKIFDRIDEYEEKANVEAKFIYALDKIVPEFNIILGNGSSRHQFNNSRSELKKHMEKSKLDQDIRQICQEIYEQLDAHDEWFPRP